MVQLIASGGKGDFYDFPHSSYLRHVENSQATYFLTFRLNDSLPVSLLLSWQKEAQFRKSLQKNNQHAIRRVDRDYHSKIEGYLDTNAGRCWLKDPLIASMVASALRYFDGKRYDLQTWTIMPNHVHALFSIHDAFNLASIVHSWKSFTSKQANHLLERSGRFWQPEYFERLIKSDRHFEFCVRYILNNPVKAGLCKEAFEWPWSGCSPELERLLKRFF